MKISVLLFGIALLAQPLKAMEQKDKVSGKRKEIAGEEQPAAKQLAQEEVPTLELLNQLIKENHNAVLARFNLLEQMVARLLPSNGQPVIPTAAQPPKQGLIAPPQPPIVPVNVRSDFKRDLGDALNYYYGKGGAQKKYAQAINLFSPIAEQNHDLKAQADAWRIIGCIYWKGGNGVQKNFVKALEYLNKAAQQNIDLMAQADAWRVISCIYLEGGNGVQKDVMMALEYLHKAAQQNHDLIAQGDAWRCIGCIYWRGGNGVQKDFVKALEYLNKAAQQNNDLSAQADAWRVIGCIYYEGGNGVQKDAIKAREFLNLAVNQEIDPHLRKYAEKALELIALDQSLGTISPALLAVVIEETKEQL